ncbi:LysR family transcriptional regulator [Trinickia fusca]|uniref:LysR family transcriptional regulator n=1 Tax=Trinickia fusca TaxID=2419777 RepID=A0A494XLA9_9BURK|nr:LysR family transcriptional regulator [Trinickia fusca]RKP50522.1 LysR family transcriptional regulator [Trinickia fusca]
MSNLHEVNLNRLVVFVTVVETGSLTAAALRLGLAKTMVSTHMQRLEAEVGASLLVRTTRRLSLTDAGEAFYEASRRIVRDAEEAIEAAGQDTVEPRGTLRVTASVVYGATVVAPVAVALRKRYPALKIDLLVGDHLSDLVNEGIDVAVRIGRRLADSSYQAVRIGGFADWLVAHPGVFGGRGAPKTLDALVDYPFMSLSALQQPLTWTFEHRDGGKQTVRFESSMSANSAYALWMAALAGGGLAVLPDFIVAADVAAGRLVRVLPEYSLPSGGIHALFPASRHRPRKIRVFVEALKQHVDDVWGESVRAT